MNEKEKYFIDLSKCSEEQIKELALIMMRTKKLHDKAFNYMSKGKTFDHFICLAQTDSKEWTLWNINALFNKTELLYPEFIKLFEGGDGKWDIFKPHKGSTETETMGKSLIKSDTKILQNALEQIEKLEAEKAELVSYLEHVLFYVFWNGGNLNLKDKEKIESLIQKHKQ